MTADDGRRDDAMRGPDATSEIGDRTTTSTAAAPAHASSRSGRRASSQRRLEAAERRAARRAERQARGRGPWRTVIWPGLRLVVLAVIAVALVRIAFFPATDATEASGELPPTASVEEPLVAATIGTVRNDLALEGQVLPNDAVPVRSAQTGTVARVTATDGQEVDEGVELYVVRVETQASEPDEEGVLPPPTVALRSILSPSAGVLTGFEVLLDQQVQVGDETGAVQPSTFRVDAQLTAQQQYRLTSEPTEGEVRIDGGPAPFACTDLAVLQPTQAAGGPGGAGGAGAESDAGVATATMRCQVPGDVRVFSGLAADVTIAGGVAEDVVTLPTTAVLGSADTGTVVRVADDGTEEEVAVELGLTDGQRIEIRSGLDEGAQVLQFVPGGEPEVDPCADPASPEYDPIACGEVMP